MGPFLRSLAADPGMRQDGASSCGDDNLCNIPQALPCSPTKQSKKENKGRRLLFGEQPAPGSPEKRAGWPVEPVPRDEGGLRPSRSRWFLRQQLGETGPAGKQRGLGCDPASGTLASQPASQEGFPAALGWPEGLFAVAGEPVLDTSAVQFCARKVSAVSGDARKALDGELARSRTVVLNCMRLSSSQAVFPAVAEQLGLQAAARAAGREIARKLEKQLTAKGPMVLLVLDEMDQLDSKGQDVLYTVFEWPWLAGSRLVLIASPRARRERWPRPERALGRGRVRRCCCAWSWLLRSLQPGKGREGFGGLRRRPLWRGDLRDLCPRRAVEMVERDVRSQTVLKPLPGCE
nr:PREDICTED: cell division control protein 6 homolog [Apteryx mantelli mantelli]